MQLLKELLELVLHLFPFSVGYLLFIGIGIYYFIQSCIQLVQWNSSIGSAVIMGPVGVIFLSSWIIIIMIPIFFLFYCENHDDIPHDADWHWHLQDEQREGVGTRAGDHIAIDIDALIRAGTAVKRRPHGMNYRAIDI